jgi:arylsulfatase A-like enzyme
MHRRTTIALALLLLPEAGAARVGDPVYTHPNIVLITVDTLRADHLSCYGYSKLTSPHIDELGREGARFANAYSPVPLTGPSHISLMTSLFPQQHGATINGMHMSTKPSPILLAQILHRAGYRTAAFVSAWPLKRGITGLGRGFQVYNQKFTYHYELVNSARTADRVGSASREWIRRYHRDPFFIWIHYFDPHTPYELHPEYSGLPPSSPSAAHRVQPVGLDADAANRIRSYDSEIAYVDHDLAKTLALLAQLGLRDNTLLILTADHGESLGEDGIFGHGFHLDQPTLHIPLIVVYPNVIPAHTVVTEDVSLVDVMPTIMDFVGLRPGRLPLEGRSLRPLIAKSSTPRPAPPAYFVVYSEPPLLPPSWISWIWHWAKTKMSPTKLGFVHGNVKVVWNYDAEPPHVFKLNNDFTVALRVDKKWKNSNAVGGYQVQLANWFERTNRGLASASHLSQQDREMLRSLGYANP